MKTKTDNTAAAALRVLNSINRELIANRRDREKRDRRAKKMVRIAADVLGKSNIVPPELVRAMKEAL